MIGNFRHNLHIIKSTTDTVEAVQSLSAYSSIELRESLNGIVIILILVPQ